MVSSEALIVSAFLIALIIMLAAYIVNNNAKLNERPSVNSGPAKKNVSKRKRNKDSWNLSDM